MSVEIKVPELPESVADATIGEWHKQPGDTVERGENIVDLETDKVVLEVPAPGDGVLGEILHEQGDTVEAGDVIARLGEGNDSKTPEKKTEAKDEKEKDQKEAEKSDQVKETKETEKDEGKSQDLSPAVRRLIAEHDLDPAKLEGSGKNGRITKQDVENYLEKAKGKQSAEKEKTETTTKPGRREEKRVPMSRLRARVAERLMAAKNNTAMLTTFNEVNMQAVMDVRKSYKESFEKKYDVRLGFMSFFTKAVVEALKRFPDVNASIDGKDIVYHGYFDIGMAVSTDRGLVVPIVRDADQLGMAEVEKQVASFAKRARDGQITMDEMSGGTFTITNGGVFGSLLSTPILNPPQSAILGLHKIEERAVVVNGEIVVRPMMYLALSYDHRIIDGKQSVQFLRTIKELIEDPARLLLEV